jgi:DNA repair protein RadA/Sms
MAKNNNLYECQSCGYKTNKWMGKCPSCNSWDSFIEIKRRKSETKKAINIRYNATIESSKAIPITEVEVDTIIRSSSGSKELDLVLGGGIVEGSLVLIGGSPGIGKSTLLLKVAGDLAKSKKKVLYVSGEESASQIKLRANRLGADSGNLFLLNEIELESVIDVIEGGEYSLVVIDSIQTLYSSEISSSPASVTQVRAVTFELMRVAKSRAIPIFIIGHITKDGSIAGPRVLEHMVDVVLYFEGDTNSDLRILRGFKNRFGSTNEIGIFEMDYHGLRDAKSTASRFFNAKGSLNAGSALTVIMEGSRPIIIEVQALVTPSYGHPRRSSTGFDINRLNMLLALLEKKLSLPLGTYDIFVNIAGGIKINETGADLAIVASILSSFRDRSLNPKSLFIGEVSLTGELKSVPSLLQRLKEAESQGFEKAIIPVKPIDKFNLTTFVVDSVERVIEWM